MMKIATIKRRVPALLALVAGLATVGAVALTPTTAFAYQPTAKTFYTASADEIANFNKKNPILYPKSAQLENGTLVATFERSVGDPVGQTMPVYSSSDYGTSWTHLSDVKSPAELTKGTKREAEFSKWTSAWTNPYLYVMPETVGSLTKGTLLLAAVVSGDDPYLKEQLAADPNFNRTSDDFDREDVALALYSSTDGGVTWDVQNIVAEGGWQGSYGGPFATENSAHQNDPIWEPFLMVYDGKLVCYYSDENEYDWSSYNSTNGTISIADDNATAVEDGGSGQILAHKTWDGAGNWSTMVVDDAGSQFEGKYAGGGRPGMTTVVPTEDGKWLMTFEWHGGGNNVQYKIADNPLEFYKVQKTGIGNLGNLSMGGNSVLIKLPDGRILYNASNSSDIWVNESGRSDGSWKQYKTTVDAGYSRNMQYVPQTGRIVILQGTFGGYSISYGEVDLGKSKGAYYQLVNKKTGQVLGTNQKTQDDSYNNNSANVKTEVQLASSDAAAETQYWHVVPADGTSISDGATVALINKSGGRSLGIWQNNVSQGALLTQWVDEGNRPWTLVDEGNGYYRLKSTDNSSLFATGYDLTNVKLATALNDGSQEWKLVRETDEVKSAQVSATQDITVGEGTSANDVNDRLPATVDVKLGNSTSEYDDGSQVTAPVKWDVSTGDFSTPGTVKIKGTVKVAALGVDETELVTSANVTVTAKETSPQTVDKAQLQQIANQAETMKKTDYTATSWGALSTALSQARTVLANSAATQKQVNGAEDALRNAVKALVLNSSKSNNPKMTTISGGQKSASKDTSDSKSVTVSGKDSSDSSQETEDALARTGSDVFGAVVGVILLVGISACALVMGRRRQTRDMDEQGTAK
jgi:hypothetical protein